MCYGGVFGYAASSRWSLVVGRWSLVVGRWSLVVGLGLLLASCGKQGVTPAGNVLTEAREIPIVVGQALALKDKLETGAISLQAAKDLQMVTEKVYDFLDRPFYHLTVTAQDPSGKWRNLWDAVASYQSSQSYTVYGTGGSDIRGIYNFEFSGDLVEKLGKTLAAAGSYSRLVSPYGSILYLQDKRGRFWNVWKVELVSEEQLKQDRDTYQHLKKQFESKPDLVRETKEAWALVTNNGQVSPSSPDLVSIDDFVSTEGALNIPRLIEKLQAKGISVQRAGVSAQGDYKTCIGWFCTTSIFSHIVGYGQNDIIPNWDNPKDDPKLKQSLLRDEWGNWQSVFYEGSMLPPYYSYWGKNPNGGKWGIRFFNPLIGGYKSDHYINGCAAQTLTRLMGWYFKYRNATNGKPNLLTSRYATSIDLARDMNRPVLADSISTSENVYEPYVTKLMGGGEFDGGTLITPWSFQGGANAWLNEVFANSTDKYELRGTYFFKTENLSLPTQVITAPFNAFDFGFNRWTWDVHNGTRNTIYFNSEPFVALFNAGNKGGHFAPTFAYKNYTNPMYVDVYVWINGKASSTNGNPGGNIYIDGSEGVGPTGWVNITNRWDIYGGGWGLFKK